MLCTLRYLKYYTMMRIDDSDLIGRKHCVSVLLLNTYMRSWTSEGGMIVRQVRFLCGLFPVMNRPVYVELSPNDAQRNATL